MTLAPSQRYVNQQQFRNIQEHFQFFAKCLEGWASTSHNTMNTFFFLSLLAHLVDFSSATLFLSFIQNICSPRAMTSLKNDAGIPTAEWDEVANRYSDNIQRFTSLHSNDLIGVLKKDILKAKTVLDVGCGTGAFGLAYLQQFPKGIPGQTLILSDLSPGMVSKAKAVMENAVAEGFLTELKYQVEDGSTLKGIENESIDVVVSSFGIFLIPDRSSAFQAVQRVLKPSGIFGNAAWTSIDCRDGLKKEEYGVGFQDAIQASLATINDMYDKRSPPYADWVDPHNTHKMLVGEAGFGSTQIYRSIHSVVWDFEEMWQCLEQAPNSKFKDDPEGTALARNTLRDYVFIDGAQNEELPFVVWTASNLVIARGLPSK